MTVNAYPLIFKKRVCEFYNNNKNKITIKELVKIFNISIGSLYNWLKQYNNNSLQEKKKYIKCSKYTPIIKSYIKSYILQYPSFDYIVLMKKVMRKFNITISKTSLYEIINKLNFTRKKFKLRIIPNKNKYENNIKAFKKKVNKIPLNNIVSIDETSIDTHIHPNLGWSLRGTELKKTYIRSRIKYTVITAITNKRILNYKIIKGSSNAEDFKTFLIDTCKKTNKSMYLLMDNARIHHSKVVVDYIKTTNHQIIYNVLSELTNKS